MRKQPEDAAATREALKFFALGFASGDKLAEAAPLRSDAGQCRRRDPAAVGCRNQRCRWQTACGETQLIRADGVRGCDLCHIRAQRPDVTIIIRSCRKFVHADNGAHMRMRPIHSAAVAFVATLA